MTKAALTVALGRAFGLAEFAMIVALFSYLALGAFDQGFPLLGTALAAFIGLGVGFLLLWPTAPLTAADVENASTGEIVGLSVKLAVATVATCGLLYAISAGFFPR